MDAALLHVGKLPGGGKEVRIAVTQLEVELPYLLEKYQQKGIVQGEHKASVKAALQNILLIIECAASEQDRLAVEDPAHAASESDASEEAPVDRALHLQRAARFRNWIKAIKSIAATNKPTSLLTLKLTPRPETAEPWFMQILDNEARRLPVQVQVPLAVPQTWTD